MEVPTSYHTRSGSIASNIEKRGLGLLPKEKHALSSSGTEASGNKADGELTPPKTSDIQRVEDELQRKHEARLKQVEEEFRSKADQF